jgi:hypothetical protein
VKIHLIIAAKLGKIINNPVKVISEIKLSHVPLLQMFCPVSDKLHERKQNVVYSDIELQDALLGNLASSS